MKARASITAELPSKRWEMTGCDPQPNYFLSSHHFPGYADIDYWSPQAEDKRFEQGVHSNALESNLSEQVITSLLKGLVTKEVERVWTQHSEKLRAEIRSEIERELGIDSPDESSSITDSLAEWVGKHAKKLAAFPNSFVAFDLKSDAILFAEENEWVFSERLAQEEAKAGHQLATVHTSALAYVDEHEMA